MKKTYIEPEMNIVSVRCMGVIAGSISGDGLQMDINNTTIDGAADSRRSSLWDEE